VENITKKKWVSTHSASSTSALFGWGQSEV
jgi:hypothetical protein